VSGVRGRAAVVSGLALAPIGARREALGPIGALAEALALAPTGAVPEALAP
jgi:hypothetical protein